MAIEMIFFDIGGTLGERDQATGRLVPFPSTAGLLTTIRDKIRLRMGVITTLGGLSNAQGRDLLAQAGLLQFFDPAGFISEHDVNGDGKPKPAIYKFAAQGDRGENRAVSLYRRKPHRSDRRDGSRDASTAQAMPARS